MAEPSAADRSRRTGHRIGSLRGRDRWLVIGLVAVFGVVPFVAAGAALARGWQPTGDVAVIALRGRDAWTAHPPLVGQPTTGEEFTGKPSNHPGPIEYWVLGLTLRIFGARAGVVLGAALLNAASLVGIAWLAFRRGGPALLALVAAALAALVHALHASALYDPFNSELSLFPMLLALLAAWSVVAGDLRVAPVLAGAATVAAQVHVAGAAFVAPLVAVAVGSVVLVARRHPRAVRRELPWLGGAAAVLLVGWLPPIVQELSSGPSNVAALWTTATAPRPRIGWAFGLERLFAAVAPIPIFVRSTGRFGFTEDVAAVLVLVAAVLLGGLVTLGLLVRDAGRRRDAFQFGGLVLFAAATSVWFGAGQPPLAAFRADGTRWLWVISLAVWVGVAWCGWLLLGRARQDRARPLVLPVAAALAGLLLVVALAGDRLADQRDGKVMGTTDEVASSVIRNLPTGTYRLRFEGNQALITVGPGVAYRLEAAGYHVRVDDNAFGRAYGDQRVDRPAANGTLRIASGPLTKAEDGERLVAEVTEGSGATATTIRVFQAAPT